MPEPLAVEIPDRVYRVARSRSLLDFSEITPEDARLSTAGNRFDVPGGAVLYAASTVDACFAEVLARYRPTPFVRELLKDEKGFMVTGGVPQDWRLNRSIAEIHIEDPLPFLDLQEPATHEHLSRVLASELVGLGYTENVDFSEVCNKDRRLSRAIASWAFTTRDESGEFCYGGIRYASRIDPRWENWAIFDGSPIDLVSQTSIDLGNDDLKFVADMWELRIF